MKRQLAFLVLGLIFVLVLSGELARAGTRAASHRRSNLCRFEGGPGNDVVWGIPRIPTKATTSSKRVAASATSATAAPAASLPGPTATTSSGIARAS
ncbi:MAG: hypothetical protein ABI990_09560 [Actinomycetota bacterium]